MTWTLTWAITAVLVVASQCQEEPKAGTECVPSRDIDVYRLKKDDCTFFWKCQLTEAVDKYLWVESKCVDGTVFNQITHRCEPPQTTTKCKGYIEPKLVPTEKAILPGCEDKFICPADLQFFIYPDWNNCRNYYTCQQGTISTNTFWRTRGIVVHRFELMLLFFLGACGYKDYLPPMNVKIAPRTIRPGCERVFQCPPDLQFFIYPDWNNCSNYNTCVQGTISPESCLTLGYPWYNPSTFACEQQIASNNVCFFRSP